LIVECFTVVARDSDRSDFGMVLQAAESSRATPPAELDRGEQ